MVTKLCVAAPVVPVVVCYVLEQILCALSTHDTHAEHLVQLMVPHMQDKVARTEQGGGNRKTNSPQLQLMALHVTANSLKFLTSAQMLRILPVLVPAILPSLSSPLVDVRKAVVVTLVQIFLTVGDALYPHIVGLSSAQRKLVTIYINKELKQRGERKGERGESRRGESTSSGVKGRRLS